MTRTHATTPPPVSKTVQRLLAQIHAEAEAHTLEALSAKDGIVVLHPMPIDGRRAQGAGGRGFQVIGADGSVLRFYIDHEVNDRRLIGPRYSAQHCFKDGQGREWSRYLGFDFITDDFGNLVDVEGGAA